MRHLKKFNESAVDNDEILNYLKSTYTSEWFDQELSSRVNDYITDEDAEEYDGDLEEAYKNLATGGAIEYDLLDEIAKDIQSKFNITSDDYYKGISDLVNDYLIDTCTWYDRFVFKKSTEKYQSMSDRLFGKSSIDISKWGNPTTESLNDESIKDLDTFKSGLQLMGQFDIEPYEAIECIDTLLESTWEDIEEIQQSLSTNHPSSNSEKEKFMLELINKWCSNIGD